MDDLQFYVLFNSISVRSGRWEFDNERLFATETRLRLKSLTSTAGLSALPTKLSGLLESRFLISLEH